MLGGKGSRDVDFENDRPPDAPFVDLLFCRRITGVESTHEPHLKEGSGLLLGLCHVERFRQMDRRGLFAKRRLFRGQRLHDDVAMRVGRTDDDDRIDVPIGNQIRRIRIGPGNIEFGRDLLRQLTVGIGNRRQLRRGNPRTQIACVDAAQPSQSNQSDIQPRHYFSPLVTSSMRTFTSGCATSPRSAFTAFSIAAFPISSGNWATDASIGPFVDCLARVLHRIETDDLDLAGLAGRANRLDRAERHHVVAGEHGVDLGMGLQHVLKHIEPLIALPVGRLRRNDLDPWRRRDPVLEPAHPRVAGLVTRNTFEHADVGLAARCC